MMRSKEEWCKEKSSVSSLREAPQHEVLCYVQQQCQSLWKLLTGHHCQVSVDGPAESRATSHTEKPFLLSKSNKYTAAVHLGIWKMLVCWFDKHMQAQVMSLGNRDRWLPLIRKTFGGSSLSPQLGILRACQHLLPPFLPVSLFPQDSANLVSKDLSSEWLSLCRPLDVRANPSTLPSWHKDGQTHQQIESRLCAGKMYLRMLKFKFHIIFGVIKYYCFSQHLKMYSPFLVLKMWKTQSGGQIWPSSSLPIRLHLCTLHWATFHPSGLDQIPFGPWRLYGPPSSSEVSPTWIPAITICKILWQFLTSCRTAFLLASTCPIT